MDLDIKKNDKIVPVNYLLQIMAGREHSVPLLGVVRSGGSFSRQCDPKQVNS